MLPSDFPAWYHVWYYYRTWRDDGTWDHINTLLRRDAWPKAGRDPEPSVGIIDSQSVTTTEMGGEKGFNPHKQVKGRKRHLLVVVFVPDEDVPRFELDAKTRRRKEYKSLRPR